MSYQAICDWLDLSYSPDDDPCGHVTDVLQASLFTLQHSIGQDDKLDTRWSSPSGGSVVLRQAKRFTRISASGAALGYLRSSGAYSDYLTSLSLSPHRITRLDAAYDVYADAVPILRALQRRHPVSCALLRKSVPTSTQLAARHFDHLQSGTFYVGHRKSGSTTARVYDKRKEQYDRYKTELGYHLTRYEITARKSLSVALRDAFDPTALFWHVASPNLLRAPSGVPVWHPADPDSCGWSFDMPEFTPYTVLKNRVQNNPELASLIELADRVGPEGRTALLRLLTSMIDNPSTLSDKTNSRKAS